MLGNDVKVELFGPPKGELPDAIQSYNDAKLNYYSIVVKLTYKNQSFLFPGDIYKDMEEKLNAQYGDRLKADYLHAPHHGEVTSSSPKFIEKVAPKAAVLSSNIWVNMPLLERLERGVTKAYNTGINKNILITSDGKQLQVFPEKDRPAQK
ncbi:ComEC/Rec2 family competence protein [Paenibacillus allorhizosphaerae]|uniref:MBL fold metallo-hydrolase n=1 Tax=Paenibacillus allorhizosphaerae TaxID=2849866 RepID=A0ABM8VIT7_9BACL|nr:hypothetical protein [Paenibacillus allorhizosphaerae]CAG7644422.1 hypothetical protein PAECIP111802_03261 [Paenibacillus allorhizosphaerae]